MSGTELPPGAAKAPAFSENSNFCVLVLYRILPELAGLTPTAEPSVIPIYALYGVPLTVMLVMSRKLLFPKYCVLAAKTAWTPSPAITANISRDILQDILGDFELNADVLC